MTLGELQLWKKGHSNIVVVKEYNHCKNGLGRGQREIKRLTSLSSCPLISFFSTLAKAHWKPVGKEPARAEGKAKKDGEWRGKQSNQHIISI